MNLKEIHKKNSIWIFSTHLSEGFPVTIMRTVLPIFLRDLHYSLETIGFTSLYNLPWILKFLWAPFIDRYSTKRQWVITSQLTVSVLMFLVAVLIPLSFGIPGILIIFFIAAIVSSLFDAAVDGYYLKVLNHDEQAKFVGLRVLAYRIATVIVGGSIVTVGATKGWSIAFIILGIILSLLFTYHLLFLPYDKGVNTNIKQLFEKIIQLKSIVILIFLITAIIGMRNILNSHSSVLLEKYLSILGKLKFSNVIGICLLLSLLIMFLFRTTIKNWLMNKSDSYYSRAFLSYIDREDIIFILMFITLFRFGEWIVTMVFPMFIVDLGIKIHYGWLLSLVGLPGLILGTLFGGLMIYEYGLKRVVWPFVVLQNTSNLLCLFLSYYLSGFIIINTGVANPDSIGISNLVLVAVTMIFEQFASGLGTAIFMTFLMRLCLSEFSATHYAIGTSLMNVCGVFASIVGSYCAGSLGYTWVFGISFFASLPAMMLIPFLTIFKENRRLHAKTLSV